MRRNDKIHRIENLISLNGLSLFWYNAYVHDSNMFCIHKESLVRLANRRLIEKKKHNLVATFM